MDFSEFDKLAPKADEQGVRGTPTSSMPTETGSLDLYRGYVITTKEKKSIDKFRDIPREQLRTYEQVQGLDNFAGVLADDIVLVDIDNMDNAKRILKLVKDLKLHCRVHSSRGGMHFLFTNKNRIARTKTNWTMPLGINTDIKVGCKNSLEILKVDGVERTVLYDLQPYEEVPAYLVPYKQDGQQFGGLTEGSRNNALYAYILTLCGIGFNKDETKNIINLINDYILGEPLDSASIATITRDEAFSAVEEDEPTKWFGQGGKFYFDKFAKYLKDTYNIIRMDKNLFIYQNGVYVNGNETIERAMIQNISLLNKTKRQEVLSYLNLICSDGEMADARFIAFNNGIYDAVEDTMIPFSPDMIMTNKIPYDYNPTATSADMDKMISDLACADPEIIKQIEEMVGMSFYRRNEIRGGSFLIIGDKENGKSTFFDILNNLLGTQNCANLDLAQLGEKFENTDLYLKLANIGDDISGNYIPDTRSFKVLSTGGALQVQNKGLIPFTFRYYGKLFFSANEIPRTNDRTGAVVSRMTIVPFKNKFNPSNPEYDPNIKYRIMKSKDAMERLICRGVEGMKRVLLNNAYTESVASKEEKIEYQEYNNPIIGFFNEHSYEDFENEATSNVYMEYSVYCSNNNCKPMSAITFSKEVCKKYNLKSVAQRSADKKTIRVFKKN